VRDPIGGITIARQFLGVKSIALGEVRRPVRCQLGQLLCWSIVYVQLTVISTSTMAVTFRLFRNSPSPIRACLRTTHPPGKDREWATVLYKKICLRCTKLYFRWQTILLIPQKLMNFLLKLSNNHMKNIAFSNTIRT